MFLLSWRLMRFVVCSTANGCEYASRVARAAGQLRTVASREEAPPAPAPAAKECAPDRLRLTRSLRSSRPSGNSCLVVYLGSCLASDSHPPMNSPSSVVRKAHQLRTNHAVTTTQCGV